MLAAQSMATNKLMVFRRSHICVVSDYQNVINHATVGKEYAINSFEMALLEV